MSAVELEGMIDSERLIIERELYCSVTLCRGDKTQNRDGQVGHFVTRKEISHELIIPGKIGFTNQNMWTADLVHKVVATSLRPWWVLSLILQ